MPKIQVMTESQYDSAMAKVPPSLLPKDEQVKRAGHTNTRDMFPGSGAGKGDANRVRNVDAYRKNYEEINWGHRPASNPQPGTVCESGEAGAVEERCTECGPSD